MASGARFLQITRRYFKTDVSEKENGATRGSYVNNENSGVDDILKMSYFGLDYVCSISAYAYMNKRGNSLKLPSMFY